MRKVMIVAISTGGSGGEDRLTENVTLNFAEVEFEYKQQADEGGEEKMIPFKWDIRGNVKL